MTDIYTYYMPGHCMWMGAHIFTPDPSKRDLPSTEKSNLLRLDEQDEH